MESFWCEPNPSLTNPTQVKGLDLTWPNPIQLAGNLSCYRPVADQPPRHHGPLTDSRPRRPHAGSPDTVRIETYFALECNNRIQSHIKKSPFAKS
jgi:hypothetical protein